VRALGGPLIVSSLFSWYKAGGSFVSYRFHFLFLLLTGFDVALSSESIKHVRHQRDKVS